MKQAIIYGGAFNPPTLAHQEIMQQCVSIAKKMTAEVWVLPSGDRADKKIEGSIGNRLQLVEALCRSVNFQGIHSRVEQSEINNNIPTETYATVEYLQSKYPKYHLTWVFGSDSIGTMKRWRKGVLLHETLDMVIVQRPGVALNAIPPKAIIMEYSGPKVSSTMVRECIKNGTSYTKLVPPHVYDVLSRQLHV